MNWRKAKLLREHLIMSTDQDREHEPLGPFHQRPREPLNPPFKSTLTVIWEEEKKALHHRLDTQALMIEELGTRVKTLEAWAIQLRREPTVFTRPVSPMERDYEGPTEGGR